MWCFMTVSDRSAELKRNKIIHCFYAQMVGGSGVPSNTSLVLFGSFRYILDGYQKNNNVLDDISTNQY